MNLSKFLLPFAVALCPLASHATILATDSFVVGAGGYSTANNGQMYGVNPTLNSSGFSGAWGNANSQTTGNLRANGDGLSHPLVAGSALGGSIFAVANNTGRTTTRAFDSTVTTAISSMISNNETLYFSGLIGGDDWLHQASGGSTIQLGLGANRTHSELNTNGGVFARVGDNGELFLATTTNANTTTNTSVATLTAGETYLFAISIAFNNSANHLITLDLFDNTGSISPTATSSVSISSADFGINQLSYLVFAHNNTGNSTNATTPRFDEFRLGTDLIDVVAIPEPSTYAAIFAIGALGMVIIRRRMQQV